MSAYEAGPAAARCELGPGVLALPGGFAFLPAARALLVADAHLAYEDVMGGALPLWSTAEAVGSITIAIERTGALEVVMLGDVIHGSRMSEGAARAVVAALDVLRERARVTIVAGNHEGRSRGVAVLGPTVEACERDGWLLMHGDKPRLERRAIIGHLHPSLRIGGAASAPVFLGGDRLVVIPALTPYSPGLSVLSLECTQALAPWNIRSRDVHVVALGPDAVYPFGSLAALRRALAQPSGAAAAGRHRFRRRLRAD